MSKLALDIGSSDSAAAWAADAAPSLLRVGDDGSRFLPSRLLWQNGQILAVGHQSRTVAASMPPGSGAVLLDGFKQDFAVTRLRYLESDAQGNPRPSQPMTPRGYEGPFFRRGLVMSLAAILRGLWARVEKQNPNAVQACERLYVGQPMHFHEFSRRRFLFALKEALGDWWKPRSDFYRQTIQRVHFVHEPLATLASLSFLYDGRANAALAGSESRTVALVDIGAGTCDCAVVRLTPNEHVGGRLAPEPVLSSVSEPAAGHAIDRVMLDGLRKIDPDLGVFIENQLTEPSFRAALIDSLRAAKHQFSDPNTAGSSVQIPDGSPISIERDVFRQWIAPIAQKVETTVERCVDGAGLTVDEVDHVVLVGGSALLPDLHEPIVKLFGEAKVVVPHIEDQEDARGAVAKGLAYLDTFAEPIRMRPGERKLKLFETNWNPEKQSPPPQERLRVIYDPQRPDANQHKDLWWRTLHVPSGFGPLSISLFESALADEHLFTLYGVPLPDAADSTVPERFQVYVDPRGRRAYPKIWIWDVTRREFLIKGFDVGRQPESALAAYVEQEEPAFAYLAGEGPSGIVGDPTTSWLPPVKRLALGDMVRVYTGDRQQPHWRNGKLGSDGVVRVPVQRVAKIVPANAPASSKGIAQCTSWRLSDYRIGLDDEPVRNLQALCIEHVPDRSASAHVSIDPALETPLLRDAVRAVTDSAVRDALPATKGAAPAANPFGTSTDALPSKGTNTVRNSQRVPVPRDAVLGGQAAADAVVGSENDPFGEGVLSAFDGASQEDSSFDSGSDGALGAINWTADQGAWVSAIGGGDLDADSVDSTVDESHFPDSIGDSSSTNALGEYAGRETAVWRHVLAQLAATSPANPREARVLLESLLLQVARDQVPADRATAIATIVHALMQLPPDTPRQ